MLAITGRMGKEARIHFAFFSNLFNGLFHYLVQACIMAMSMVHLKETNRDKESPDSGWTKVLSINMIGSHTCPMTISLESSVTTF